MPRGRPVPADLHVGLHRAAEGGPLHAGPVRPDGRARRGTSPSSSDGDVVYSPLPFFHSSSLFTGWSSALNAGVPIATRPRFSASNTLPDIRRYGATMLTYTGKVLNYILATPEQPDDADNSVAARARQRSVDPRHPRVRAPLRLRRPRQLRLDGGHHHHPSRPVDARRRARCRRTDGEGARSRDGRRVPARDVRAGRPADQPRRGGRRDRRDRARRPASRATTRTRRRPSPASATGGTGRATSRTATPTAGSTSRAGRTSGCASTARTSPPHPSRRSSPAIPTCASVAVYAVPDDPVGDRVMVALELWDGRAVRRGRVRRASSRNSPISDRSGFRRSYASPTELPKLASMKLDKQRLRRDAWRAGPVFWRPGKGQALRLLDDADRRRLDPLLPV